MKKVMFFVLVIILALFALGCLGGSSGGGNSAPVGINNGGGMELLLSNLGFSTHLNRVGLNQSANTTARANAPYANEGVDSITYAQMFSVALDLTKEYHGVFFFNRSVIDGDAVSVTAVRGSFIMTPDGMIKYLSIGIGGAADVVVVNIGDEPIYGLPTNAIGEARDYHLLLHGVDTVFGVDACFILYGHSVDSYLADRQYRLTDGDFWDEVFESQEPILVELYLTRRKKMISCDLPDGVDPDNFILQTLVGDGSDDGSDDSCAYNVETGTFEKWFNPVGGAVLYYIVDLATGIEYSRGELFFSYNDELQINIGDSSPVNLILPGNVINVPLPEEVLNYRWYADQQLDGEDANGEPCKVYITNLHEKNLFFYTIDLQNCDVHILDADTGEEVDYVRYLNGGSFISLGEGYSRIIIIVRGTLMESRPDGFTVFFSQISAG